MNRSQPVPIKKGARRREAESERRERDAARIKPTATRDEVESLILAWYYMHDRFDLLLKHFKGDAVKANAYPDTALMSHELGERYSRFASDASVKIRDDDVLVLTNTSMEPECGCWSGSPCCCDRIPRSPVIATLRAVDGDGFELLMDDYSSRFDVTTIDLVTAIRHLAHNMTPEVFAWLDRVKPHWLDILKKLLRDL